MLHGTPIPVCKFIMHVCMHTHRYEHTCAVNVDTYMQIDLYIAVYVCICARVHVSACILYLCVCVCTRMFLFAFQILFVSLRPDNPVVR